jgi:hypothetical protein
MENIRDLVFENLNIAAGNGYFKKGEHLHGASPEDIADDMICYAGDMENYTVEQILPHIKEWLEIRQVMGRVMPCR